MPLQSMTGFGRGEAADDKYTVSVEVKSVNHRFKDIRFKMSSIFNSIELDLKKALTSKFKRGSFDVYINFKRSENNTKFEDIDPAKVKDFLNRMKVMVEGEGFDLEIQPTEFIRGEFMKDQDLSKDEDLINLTKDAFGKALEKLEASRVQEGEKMKKVIETHRADYEKFYRTICSQTDGFQKAVEDKLKKRFEEYQKDLNVDEPRFMQEVIYYLEKLDVHEEINRIESHLQKLDELTASQGEVGRQIDFLIQEFNRETNTIGSKSNLKEISDLVVQMKVQLEKIREQGLNLE